MNYEDFAERYVAVWNETDPAIRRTMISGLWARDGVQYTDSAEYLGPQALEARVTDAHHRFVRDGGQRFRAAGDAVGHHGAVRFTTFMEPAAGGDITWTGTVFARLGADGLIRSDHQFGDPARPGTRTVVDDFLRWPRPDLYAERVDWRVSWPVSEHPLIPWIRPRGTRAEVADHYTTFAEHCTGEVAVDRVFVDGQDAVVTGTSRQLIRSTGKRFTMAFALHLTVENGLITRHHMYEDSLAVAEAFA
ncbi:Ketosteroid isomerase-related protein [Sinosporangium album]|uniref:Ketosteroid isomerase-related protein n=1 Tax=Sinosporangium album TaxID=504805 RepID=A0A1G8G9A5_9ACTN|nr:nuclear transport factor 2 family protein [Sinosporangium album]SDH90964.1 Ketosteroid isomerase-related protein [Sinosporangium album]